MKIFLLPFLFLFSLIAAANTQYMVVMDAGSSGTRAYLYSVSNTDGQITVNEEKKYKISLPLTSVTNFNDYFETLLMNVQTAEIDNSLTNIYLHATAGVRMLPQDEQNDLMEDVRVALNEEAVSMGYPDMSDSINEDVDVLTVSEEAFYVWINDQYVSGKLDVKELSPKNTFGAIEMGGASAEVSVLSEKPTLTDMIFFHKAWPYRVSSTGYDGSGQDKAIAAMLNTYLDKTDARFAGCFPVGAPYPLDAPALTGTGDFEACTDFIQDNPVNHYKYAPQAQQYLLTGAFYYTFNALGLADQTTLQTTSNEALALMGYAFCKGSWDAVKAAHPYEDEKYLVTYCFNSAFDHHYLKAIGVSDRAPLLSVDKYNGQSMTWTLGAAYQKSRDQ